MQSHNRALPAHGVQGHQSNAEFRFMFMQRGCCAYGMHTFHKDTMFGGSFKVVLDDANLLLGFLKLCCLFRGVVVLGLVKSWSVLGINGRQPCSDLLLTPLSIIIDHACIATEGKHACCFEICLAWQQHSKMCQASGFIPTPAR